MRVLKFCPIFLLCILVAEALIKRPDPLAGLPQLPQKHTKVEEDNFVSKFEKWDINQMGKVDGDIVSPFLGHGGTYESVRPLTSKVKTIEADHVPHYSILDYLNIDKVDPKDLPENIKNVVEKRKQLHDQLMQTDYPKNEEKLRNLKKAKDILSKEISKPLRVDKWEESLRNEFTSNVDAIKIIESETAGVKNKLLKTPGDSTLELKVAKNREMVNQLLRENEKLRQSAEGSFKTPEKKLKLAELELECNKLEEVNKKLSKALNNHDLNVKKAMGVISIPYDKHRLFPSSGNAGLDAEIRGLKTADAGTAKVKMEQYDKAWASNMNEGVKNGYFKDADSFALKSSDGKFLLDSKGRKTYDYQKLWEANLETTINLVQQSKNDAIGTSKSVKGRKQPHPSPQQLQSAFSKRLYDSYAKKFMTTAIYYVKTPSEGYSRFINLYVTEYKLHFKNEFDSYKMGLSNLLEVNKDFGWLTGKDVQKLQNEHKLLDIDSDLTASTTGAQKLNEWNEVEELIKLKADKSDKPLIPNKPSTPFTDADTDKSAFLATDKVCSSAAVDGCIFVTKRNDDSDGGHHKKPDLNMDEDFEKLKQGEPDIARHEDNQNKKPKQTDVDLDGSDRKVNSLDNFDAPKLKQNMKASTIGDSAKPVFNLPTDPDGFSIDSKSFNTYMSNTVDGNGDLDSFRTKESIVEFVTKNSDKLTGTPEDIARAKALIKQENLDSHSQQTTLASKVLRNDNSNISPKTLSRYQRVKVSTSKFAAKAEKFTSKTGKFAKSYGKIMLTKGVITAYRHGDYESLALMGGRIGLEVALQGVKKMGKHIAKKATTKAMKKLGSQMEILGKMAAPIGDLADIGINIYSITKSIKRYYDPNASKFDQNDAYADIVADAIDIGFTAVAAVASLALPALAPVFAAVVFLANLITTIAVSFYKASNHVDRLNSQIPLLDYERKSEYWRFVGGRDVSGYIQELIDTKKANNIAVNMAVQFLINNPDYIGLVFPSKTMHKPETTCALQRKNCAKLLHFIPLPCSDWNHLSYCNGAGGYCKGQYSDWKCESDSGTSGVMPLIAHANSEFRCQCGSEKAPEWGYEILDNEVDFRNEQYVYQQRAAPDYAVPSGFSYMCKPSSLYNEGDRVSNPSLIKAYLCKGAIGLRSNNPRGKFMKYDLGRGSDTVRLDSSERIDNLFIVKDGYKDFNGNAGDDTFHIDGPCDSLSGRLHGGRWRDQGNTIILGPNCARNRHVEVNVTYYNVKFGYGVGSIRLYDIQRVIGRKEMVELITPDCKTRLVAGGGGVKSPFQPDAIILPSCGLQLNLTVMAEGSTHLDAGKFSGGLVFTLLSGTQMFYAAVPFSFWGTLIFKFDSNVGTLTSANVNINAKTLTLGFNNGGKAVFEFVGPPQPKLSESCEAPRNSEEGQLSLLLSENRMFNRQLIYDLKNGQMQSFYRLERESNLASSIYGYDFIDNVFHLRSGSWNAYGGRSKNQFILMSSEYAGSIDGGTGQSSLYLSNELSDYSNLEINLNSGVLRGRNTFQIRNIPNVIGRPSYTDHVITACNTKSLDLGGSAYDLVEIPALACAIQLTIAARGKMTIVDQKLQGVTTVQAGYDNKMSRCSQTASAPIKLSISNLGGGQIILLLNFPIHKLTTATRGSLSIDGGGKVSLTGIFPTIQFEEDHGPNSLLVEENGTMIGFHDLNMFSSDPKVRKGSNAQGLQNIFKLKDGTNWNIIGGNNEDSFSLESNAFGGVIDGGPGKNSLFIGSDISGNVVISSKEVWAHGSKLISFQNIQEIHGRNEQSEQITVGCEMQYVGMNGGSGPDNYDTIVIPYLDCHPKVTMVGIGYTDVQSVAERGNVDIYLQPDPTNNLKFKSDIVVTHSTIFNFPIKYPAYKLTSYLLEIAEESRFQVVRVHLKFSENDNLIEFNHKLEKSEPVNMQNVNMMFVDEQYNSIGNILINGETKELNILHVLQTSDQQEMLPRKGATGAKNIFRLHTGNWEAFGGTLDDSFILNDNKFHGIIHGLGGTNSLILKDSIEAEEIVVNLPEKTLTLHSNKAVSSSIGVNSIQIVGGRKLKQDKVVCRCDTKLVMLEGGSSKNLQDVIEIHESFCQPWIAFVVAEFTRIENNALTGNFTYHIRAIKNFDINYRLTDETKHTFKFEISFDQVENVKLEETNLEIYFENGGKSFPLNFPNPPTFQIVQVPELVADLILKEDQIPQSSIIVKSPFSGTVHGINGAENGIVVKTSSSTRLESIIGGDKDDTIFLSQVHSILLLNGKGGTNRLQFSDELHQDKELEVDFIQEKITFMEDSSSFVTIMRGITFLAGREDGFERVVLGCDTSSVKFVDEVVVKKNCGYDIRIGVEVGTRVIFDFTRDQEGRHREEENISLEEHEDKEDDEDYATEASAFEILGELKEMITEESSNVIFDIEKENQIQNDEVSKGLDESDDNGETSESSTIATSTIKFDGTSNKPHPKDERNEESEQMEELDEEVPIKLLKSSKFYYHFSSIHSFDIEVDTFAQLRLTRHIFYLNFTLSDLSSIRFSLNSSRLIYSTNDLHQLEYSHVVGELDPSAMFYSQPEFMTSEGFLLRISRYGEIIAVVANPEEVLDLDMIQQDIIPKLSDCSSRLGISFMLETQSDFIYCGSPNEISVLSNRENVTSHLIGFNQSTYEILDLEDDVYIYPLSIVEGSLHVLDLTSVISQIRNKTEHKYVPLIKQVGDNLEIEMGNWTDMFGGSVILVNGTSYPKVFKILLNSIAMEILSNTDPSSEHVGNRNKRSPGDDEEPIWGIKPVPISIPEGHVYLIAAEDLEDGVEVKTDAESKNSSFEYTKDENDLIITNANVENIEAGKRVTSFAIFDYFSLATGTSVLNPTEDDGNDTVSFGKVETVNNIQIHLGRETVNVNSNEPLVTEEGDEIYVGFYEDILEQVEEKITQDFPDIPRKFKVPLFKKIGRTTEYLYAAWGILSASIVIVGTVTWRYCRKKPQKGEYLVAKWQNTNNSSRVQIKNRMKLTEFYEENAEDYEEPKLIQEIKLADDM